MAEIPPNIPSGSSTGIVLPPKKETGKVQPKKETVRISLPSKPSTAPTIKLPTLPPGGPTGAPSTTTLPAPTPPQAVPPRATAAPAAPPRPAPIVRQAAPAAAPAISPLDQILVIAAAVTGLFAIVTTVWMMLILSGAVNQ
jgi:hypothetical protein